MGNAAGGGSAVWLAVLGLTGAALFGGGEARAATCTSSAFTMVFGPLDILAGGQLDSSATFDATCDLVLLTNSAVAIGCGLGTSCTSNLRTMVDTLDPTRKLRVEFYLDAGRANVAQAGTIASPVGSYGGTPTPVTLSLTGTKTIPVYGRVLSNQQSAPPGTYVWTGNGDPVVQYCSVGAIVCLTTATAASPSPSTATVTIPAFCTVGASSTVAFPTQGLLTADTDATGTVRVTCTNSTVYSIGIDTGANPSGATRRMKHASAAVYVAYELYADAGRTTVWGTAGAAVAGTGTGSQQAYTVHGRVPGQTTPAPGNYSDTVAITVTY